MLQNSLFMIHKYSDLPITFVLYYVYLLLVLILLSVGYGGFFCWG